MDDQVIESIPTETIELASIQPNQPFVTPRETHQVKKTLTQLDPNLAKENNPTSKKKRPNFLSLLHFAFAIKPIRFINSLKGQTLTEDNLNPVLSSDQCHTLESLFTAYYKELKSKYPGSPKIFAVILWRLFRKDIAIQIVCQVLYAASRILIPYFLFLSLKSVMNPLEEIKDAYPPAVGMFLCFVLGMYAVHQSNFNAAYASNKIKVGLLGMLFRKVNNLSLLSLQEFSIGRVINIVASDANDLDAIHFLISLIVAPFAFAGGIGLLYFFWGPSCFAGVGYMILILILQAITFRIPPHGMRKDYNGDERIRILNEVLEAIRVIKIHTWEFPLLEYLKKISVDEVKALKMINFLVGISRALVFSSQFISVFLIFLTYSETEDTVNPDKVFPTIFLMGDLRTVVTIYTHIGCLQIVVLEKLFLRTMSILDLPDVSPPREPLRPVDPENSFEFNNFSGGWPKPDTNIPPFQQKIFPPPPPPATRGNEPIAPAISNINLDAKKGDLVAVIGQIRSGKSSLLLSFTREMAKTAGELRYSGRFEYVPQEPIFLAHSIRESITFGKVYDDTLFWSVVEACCLSEMISNLPKKEHTEIAERGVNLSGSQRVLISLARALYTRAEIYLLDDPLSILDSSLSKLVFSKAIQGFLKDATVILVTSHLNFVKHANKIVVMDDGKIAAQGTFAELAKNEVGMELIDEMKERANSEAKKIDAYGLGRHFSRVYMPPDSQDQLKEDEDQDTDESRLHMCDKDDGLFIENERIDDGKVTLKIYWKYFKSIFNWWNIIPLIVLFVAFEAVGWQFMIRTSYWLQGLYSDSEAYGILAALAFGGLGVNLIKFILYFNSGLNGAHRLHDKMLKGVLHSPLKFFDRNRLGRILNRFSNDIGMVDKFLMNCLIDILEGLSMFMVFLIALWVQVPWILIPAGVAAVLFVAIYLWCRKAVNQTRGLELTTRGPLYSFFSALLPGLTAIRVRNQTEIVMNAFYKRADDYSKANLAYQATMRFMTFLMDYVTVLTVIATFCIYIHSKESPIVSGPFVNLLMMLPICMQWMLKSFIDFHALMASPARIINYCENYKSVQLVKEKDNEYREAGWPQKGQIDIRNANMSYLEQGEKVIKNFTVHIDSGEKVAVLGDSGFGMSSIVNMLMRMVYIHNKGEENVKIDNVDIEDVGLQLLRQSMTIIPQEQYLFTASIRDNMDPWKQYKDEEIWDALDAVGLKKFVESLEYKLDTYYTKGSSVFSAGQKQLLNVARALLKKSNILIEDLSTMLVDVITDQHVQNNIRERYNHATTLSTTHRLWNIASFDKVVCMKNGATIEYDEPYRLLVKEIGDQEITNTNGYFARLVLDMGSKIAKQVFKLAMEKYYKNKKGSGSEMNNSSLGTMENVDEGKENLMLGYLSSNVSEIRKPDYSQPNKP